MYYNKICMLIMDMVELPVRGDLKQTKQLLVGFIIVFNIFTDIAFLNSL